MKISNDFKIRPDPPSYCRCGCPCAFENFPIDLLFGNWCMSVYIVSFLVGKQDRHNARICFILGFFFSVNEWSIYAFQKLTRIISKGNKLLIYNLRDCICSAFF